jgi:predicted outer membrane protein
MNMLRSGRTKLVFSGIVVALLAGWTSYSSSQLVRGAPPRNDGARHEKADHFDHHVAQCLIMGNQNEIAAAKIAQKKGNDDEVKNFADNMVQDHEQFIAVLEKFAGHNYRHRDGGARRATAGNQRAAATEGTETTARNAQGKDGEQHEHMAKFMRIHEEIADQCRASVQRELDSKQGKAFDECYMGLQIGAHMKMVDELTVLSRHVSAEFKPILEKGLQTAQSHLDNAKTVLKDINEDEGGAVKTTNTSETK